MIFEVVLILVMAVSMVMGDPTMGDCRELVGNMKERQRGEDMASFLGTVSTTKAPSDVIRACASMTAGYIGHYVERRGNETGINNGCHEG